METFKNYLKSINLDTAIENVKFRQEQLPKWQIKEHERLWKILDILRSENMNLEDKIEVYHYWFIVASNFTYTSRKKEIERIFKIMDI